MGINESEEIPTLNALPLYMVNKKRRDAQMRGDEAGRHFKGTNDAQPNCPHTVFAWRLVQ